MNVLQFMPLLVQIISYMEGQRDTESVEVTSARSDWASLTSPAWPAGWCVNTKWLLKAPLPPRRAHPGFNWVFWMNYHLDLKLVSLSTDPTVIHLVLSSAEIVFPVSTMIRALWPREEEEGLWLLLMISGYPPASSTACHLTFPNYLRKWHLLGVFRKSVQSYSAICYHNENMNMLEFLFSICQMRGRSEESWHCDTSYLLSHSPINWL